MAFPTRTRADLSLLNRSPALPRSLEIRGSTARNDERSSPLCGDGDNTNHMFMHHTISRDFTGTQQQVTASILAVLGERRSQDATGVPTEPMDQPRPTGQPTATTRNDLAVLDEIQVRSWTPDDLADWTYFAGEEIGVVKGLLRLQVSGKDLMDLKVEDLRDFDDGSFGTQYSLWITIQHVRENVMANSTLASGDSWRGTYSERLLPQPS